MFFPVQDEEDAENHAAHMGKMRHAVGGASYAGEQFHHAVNQHTPFGLDGNEEIQEDGRVGKAHAECQQDAEHRSRGPMASGV